MSTYFDDFEIVPYRFGNEAQPAFFQNVGNYVDVIDQLKDQITFYADYFIFDGERPDQVAYKVYGEVNPYFTFFLLNDNIREQGWPLTQRSLDKKVKVDYPNRTLTTKASLTGLFLPGQLVTGQSSGATGTVIRRRLELGQLIIKPSNDSTFLSNELIISNHPTTGALQSVTTVGSAFEYLAVRHYVDGDLNQVDIDPSLDPPGAYTPVLFSEYYKEQNDNLRQIKIVKPSAINSVMNAFKKALAGG